ncbi:MAG: hypothetical protein ACFE0P_10030 [Oceanicaulis sp.]
MSPARRPLLIAGAGIVAVLLALLAFVWPRNDPGTPEQRDLLALLRAAETEASWPGLEIETAARTLATPEAAADFLRTGVALQDYSGRLQGEGSVLITRGANAEDKAALLAALLQAQGFETHFLTAPWPQAPPPRLIAAPARPSPALDALLARLGVDEAAERRAGVERAQARLSALRDEVEAAHAALSAAVEIAGPRPGPRPDRRILVAYGGETGWSTLDPVFDTPPPAQAEETTLAALTPVTAHLDLVTADGDRRRVLEVTPDGPEESVISFAPASGLEAFYSGPPEPGRVALWRPVITQAGQGLAGAPFTPGGRPAPHFEPAGDDGGSDPPDINEAEIVDVDLSAFPEVALTVRTDAPRDAVWRAAHIRLSEEGAAVAARVEALAQPPRHVAVVIDVSPSMIAHGRIFTAGAAGRALIARTARPQQVASAAASGEPVLTRRGAIFFEPQDAVDDFETGLVIRPGDDLAGAVRLVADPSAGPIDVVVFTDGEIGAAGLADLAQAVDHEAVRLIVAAPHLTAARFEGVADQVVSLPDEEADAEALGRALAARSGSQLKISYVAREGAPGVRRALALSFAAWDGTAEAAYATPERAVGEPRIELGLTRGGAALGEARPLVALGEEETAWALMAEHVLHVTGARIAAPALLRRYLADQRFAFELGLDRPDAPFPPGPDHAVMAAASRLAGYAEQGAETPLTGAAPLALLISAFPEPRGETLARVTTLDLLSDGGLSAVGGARAGLALAAGEAALLGGTSVNRALLQTERRIVGPRTPLPVAWPAETLRALRGSQRTLAARPDGRAGWLVEPDGRVSARLFEPAAKGARVDAIIAQFDELRSGLAVSGAVSSGLLSPYRVPGAKVGAMFAILDFDLRLFCYSTVVLGYLNEELEASAAGERAPPADWNQVAEDACDIDADAPLFDLVSNVALSAAKGELGDRATTSVQTLGGWTSTHGGEVIVNTGAGLTIDQLHSKFNERLESLAAMDEALARERPEPLPGRAAALARSAGQP